MSVKLSYPMTNITSLLEEGDRLRVEGALEASLSIYQQIAEQTPDDAAVWFKLGVVLAGLKRSVEAEKAYQRALELRDDYPQAVNNLAMIHLDRADFDSAETMLRGMLADHDTFFEGHITMGRALLDTGRAAEAQYYFRRAVAIEPDSSMAYSQLGNVLRRRTRLGEAISELQHAIRLDSGNFSAFNNLGACYFERGGHEDSERCFRASLDLQANQRHAWHNWLLLSNFQTLPRQVVFARHVEFGEHVRKICGPLPAVYPQQRPIKGRRLRIGLVSGDFRRHSVAYFLLGPLREFDRTSFDFFAFPTNRNEDHVTEQLRPLFAGWKNLLGLTDQQAADVISDARIDILVDLSGHTSSNALPVFGYKPAPVQVSWLGYPNTTGLDCIDYRITDSLVDPEDGVVDAFHSERLYRLSRPFLAYTQPAISPEVNPLPALASGHLTFGSFNARVKLGEECIALWSQILHAVPSARLVLKSPNGLDGEEDRTAMIARFSAYGIDPMRVSVLASMGELEDHLAAYGKIDVALDPFPYNGTTTTCEALWMGVPVLSLAGDRHASRVGHALLACVGLTEFAVDTDIEFVTRAKALAADMGGLAALRSTLRDRMRNSLLMDSRGLAQCMGKAFRDMWSTYCDSAQADLARAAVPPLVTLAQLYGQSMVTDETLVPGIVIPNADGGCLVVPESPKVLTTYVFLEQGRWFEKEVSFLCKAARPGDMVLDIGANIGAYSVPLALRLGDSGLVVAYEPGQESRKFLAASVTENRLRNVVVKPEALSSNGGQAFLAHGSSGEFNSIQNSCKDGATGEQVALTTLDEEARRNSWSHIDLVKIDAEGQEARILAGGASFFSSYSPLVMFEVLHGGERSEHLRWMFIALGYRIFRLAGYGDYLVAMDNDEEPATLQLNLFAAKKVTVERLASENLLVCEHVPHAMSEIEHKVAVEQYCRLPFSREFDISAEDLDSAEVGEALVAFAFSRSPAVPATRREAALRYAIGVLQELCATGPTITRLLTLARFSTAMASRSDALAAIERARSLCLAAPESLVIDEPFMPVLERFERLSANGSEAEWLIAQLDEAQELLLSFSSCNRKPEPDRLLALCRSTYRSPELVRRLVLDWAREGRSSTMISEFLTAEWVVHNGAAFSEAAYPQMLAELRWN